MIVVPYPLSPFTRTPPCEMQVFVFSHDSFHYPLVGICLHMCMETPGIKPGRYEVVRVFFLFFFCHDYLSYCRNTPPYVYGNPGDEIWQVKI